MMVKKRKIIITGADGFVGSNLKSYFQKYGFDVFSFIFENKISNRKNVIFCDITNKEGVLKSIKKIKPEIIFHAAGISSLVKCEEDKKLAEQVNIYGTRNIISAIKSVNPKIKLVFFSSDYVFDGKRGNYKEGDKRNPATFYGRTKLISEDDIKRELKYFIILRTANVYGSDGGNFFNFVLKSINQGKNIEVFNDTFFSPTYIEYLMGSVAKLIENDFSGIIHIAGKEKISRYDFASLLGKVVRGGDKSTINPVKSSSGILIAKDSSLNTAFSQKYLENFCPTIEKSFQYCLGNLIYPYFYFGDKRGRITGLMNKFNFEEINYIESIKGQIRGGHYHKNTKEAFFIVEGKILVELEYVNDKKKHKNFIVEKGDIFVVNPEIVHTFRILKDSKWINMLSKKMDEKNKDIHRFKK
jgi:dTDP-4-dehydrorhamnose reductase